MDQVHEQVKVQLNWDEILDMVAAAMPNIDFASEVDYINIVSGKKENEIELEANNSQRVSFLGFIKTKA